MADLKFQAECCVTLSAVMIIERLAVLGRIIATWVAFGSYFQDKKRSNEYSSKVFLNSELYVLMTLDPIVSLTER